MAAGVMFFNDKDEILLVKPTYKDHWEIPGGIVNQDESPQQAASREVFEELGLKIKRLNFVAVDYSSKSGPKDESLQFIFFGGILKSDELTKIRLQNEEIDKYEFVSLQRAEKLVHNSQYRTSFPLRLRHSFQAVKTHEKFYLEDGEII